MEFSESIIVFQKDCEKQWKHQRERQVWMEVYLNIERKNKQERRVSREISSSSWFRLWTDDIIISWSSALFLVCKWRNQERLKSK